MEVWKKYLKPSLPNTLWARLGIPLPRHYSLEIGGENKHTIPKPYPELESPTLVHVGNPGAQKDFQLRPLEITSSTKSHLHFPEHQHSEAIKPFQDIRKMRLWLFPDNRDLRAVSAVEKGVRCEK